MKKASKRIRAACAAAVLLLALVCVPRAFSSFANSADRYWHSGTAGTGMLHVGDCPLQVASETLTFSVSSAPAYFTDEQSFAAYDALLTAEYDFYNPTQEDITARLAFPFGPRPELFPYDAEWTDTDRYGVTVNGAAADVRLRHTYMRRSYGEEFDAPAELAKLRDGYVADEFFALDTPVTEYTYAFDGITPRKNDSPYASAVLEENAAARYMLQKGNGMSAFEGRIRVGAFVENGDTLSLYVIGDPPAHAPVWTVYENGGCKRVIEGRAALLRTQTSDFYTFVMREYPSDGAVSREDWYNAVVASCNDSYYTGGYIGTEGNVNVQNDLMRWYEYTLYVPANAHAKNTVTAPLYPSVDGWYEPPVYDYTYLLSPAKCWSSFGTLHIVIRTPWYLQASEGFDFLKTDEGYALTQNGLPDGELRFSLCPSPEPERVNAYGCGCDCGGVIFMAPVVALCLVLAFVFFAMAYLIRYLAKKK